MFFFIKKTQKHFPPDDKNESDLQVSLAYSRLFFQIHITSAVYSTLALRD